MVSLLQLARKQLGKIGLGLAALTLAACQPAPMSTSPGLGAGETVQVALLVPSGSGQASDELLARSLENAARMAITDLGSSAKIDLRVYPTAGQAAQAQAAAVQAMDEGAAVILGPVFAQEANAAGVAAAQRGVNVLSFSNNPSIAGGNVFVLGPLFETTAARLASYAVRNGKGRIMIVHDQNAQGEAGRTAIQQGVARAGGSVVATGSYEFSQNGIVQAVPQIAAQATAAATATVTPWTRTWPPGAARRARSTTVWTACWTSTSIRRPRLAGRTRARARAPGSPVPPGRPGPPARRATDVRPGPPAGWLPAPAASRPTLPSSATASRRR